MLSAPYTRAVGAAPRMISILPRHTYVLATPTRLNTLPRRLFPCDMLFARNASSAAAAARVPTSAYEEQSADDEKDPSTAFSTLKDRLHPDTLRAIKHTHMSIVQARIFPMLPELADSHDRVVDPSLSRDLLVKAKTGTGKTMAFLVPAIEARCRDINAHVEQAKIDSGVGAKWSRMDNLRIAKTYASQNTGTLILSPTRELATQIAVEAGNLSAHHQGFEVQVLLGGESRNRQIRSWQRGRKDVVVATPGRLMDLLDSEPMFADALRNTKILILDEADTLLDMGFRDDIERISKYLPSAPVRQTFLFSATVSRAIQDISKKLLSPQHTFVNCVGESDAATHTHIPQYTTVLPSGADAMPHLLRLIAHDQLLCAQEGRKSKIVVFLSTTKMTQLVADVLSSAAATAATAHRRGHRGAPATTLFPMPTRTYEMHAKRDMSRRIAVSAAFRSDNGTSTASVLITSDVSARGVDYPGVTRVIQFGVPASPDMYVHRVGRTGRGGDKGGKGRADLIVADWEVPAVSRISRDTGAQPTRITVGDVARECQELVDASNKITYTEANLGEIESWARELMQRVGNPGYVPPGTRDESANLYPNRAASEMVSSTFLAQLGFYIGRFASTGLGHELVAAGLQRFFKDMCGLERDMHISQTLLNAIRNGGGGSRGGWNDRGRGRDARRGSEDREGYRRRSGGSFGYTSAAPSRRLGLWEGETGRGGSARPVYAGLRQGGNRPSWQERGRQNSYNGYDGPRARSAPPLFGKSSRSNYSRDEY